MSGIKKVSSGVAVLSLISVVAGIVIVAASSSWWAMVGLILALLGNNLNQAFMIMKVKKILASGDKKEEIIESLAKWGQRYAEGIYWLPVGGSETPAQALDNIEQAKIAAGELVEQLDRMALAIKSCQ